MPRLDAIGIVSADMKESVRFYRLLGLEVPDATEDHLDVTLPSGLRLMFDAVSLMKQLDPDWVTPAGHPIALAFACASPKEVDDLYARITSARFRGRTAPFDAFWGQRYATVLDPDGNAVDLFAALR